MKFNPRAIQTTLTLLFFILSVISVFTIDSSHNTEVQKIFANLQETTDQKLTETVTKTSSITLSEVDKAIQSIDGKQGDKGDRGPVGLQGPRGLRGEKGLTGEQGLIGLQGIQGEQGINGSQGIQGEQGIQGNAGLQGEQGPQGATGSQGIQGEQGLQGAPGTSSILTASNGLNILTTDLRLGGDLTSNTSIPFSTFDLAYNINGTGKFKIENNGTPLISINSNGSILLENSAVVYDDLMVPGLSMKTDSSAPDLISFGPAPTNLILYGFNGSGSTPKEQVYFTIQLPHTYKEGTDISPHVHWSPINTSAGTVKWFLEYTVATINGTFSTPITISISDPSDLTTWKQQVIGFPDISGTGLTISSMLVCRLYRDPADAEDTYNSDAGLLQMDFHYQIDSIGSTSPFTK